MRNLDDQSLYTELDPGRMTQAVLDFPEQCEEARRIGQASEFPDDYRRVESIVILGMGGSAIGGDLFRALFEPELRIPVMVNRDYDLPGFVSEKTLVIASSYSGNTEETLSAYEQAKASRARIAVFSTGGQLKEWAVRDGYPVITIPGGLSPRAALGYSFHPLMAAAEKLGLIAPKDAEFQEMLNLVREQRLRFAPHIPASGNAMKELAKTVYGLLPVIYGSGAWRSVVAARWKGQFNENAKNIAYWNTFPELNHNETVGWEAPATVNKLVHIFLLRDSGESSRMRRRVEVTREIMTPAVSGFSEVWSEGNSPLARLFTLVYQGDFVSLYLSLLNGVDPSPVKMIDRLKGELAKLG